MICMAQWRSMTTLALPWVPKPLPDRDMVNPPGFDNTPGSLGRQLTYRDLRAPEVLKSRAQCYLALWTKGIQDLEPWAWQMTLLRRVSVRRRGGIKALLEGNMTSRGRVTPTASTTWRQRGGRVSQ